MKMRKWLLGTMAAAMVLPLFACKDAAVKESKEISLTVWSPAEDQDEKQGNWLKTVSENFQSQHPEWDIKFTFGTCSEGDIGKMVSQDAKNSADVYMYSNDQIGALLDANAIVKLGGEAAKEVKNSNSETIVNSVTVNDEIYGIPFTTNTWFMYYDTSVFSNEDIKSLDTMLAKAKIAFPMTTAWYNGTFFLANGGTMFGDGTQAELGIDFGGEKGVEALHYMIDLAANENFINDGDGAGLSNLRSGNVKAYFSGSWDYAEVKNILGENFGAAKLPMISINGEEKQMMAFAGSKAIGVNPNCSQQEAAVAFARYMGGKDAQKLHYEMRSVIPCNSELLKDKTIAKDVLIKAQNDTINDTAIIQPTLSEMAPYWEAAEVLGKAIISKDITKENAETKLNDYVKQLNENEK